MWTLITQEKEKPQQSRVIIVFPLINIMTTEMQRAAVILMHVGLYNAETKELL